MAGILPNHLCQEGNEPPGNLIDDHEELEEQQVLAPSQVQTVELVDHQKILAESQAEEQEEGVHLSFGQSNDFFFEQVLDLLAQRRNLPVNFEDSQIFEEQDRHHRKSHTHQK